MIVDLSKSSWCKVMMQPWLSPDEIPYSLFTSLLCVRVCLGGGGEGVLENPLLLSLKREETMQASAQTKTDKIQGYIVRAIDKKMSSKNDTNLRFRILAEDLPLAS